MANDMTILYGIVLLFISIGTILPYVNEAGGETSTTYDTDGVVEGIEADDMTAVGAFEVLGSIFSMFFWTFGALPFWLDMIFVAIRLVMAGIIARNIWIGGGA
jgi:hypothetical protein